MPRSAPASPHYRWVIVATGTLSIFACLGLGRFALGMLLPSMSSGLGLSYAAQGTVGTANFLGYLAAVLAAGPIAARTGPRPLIVAALALVSGTMLLVSRAESLAMLVVLYALTGFGSGATNVPMMGLIARWFDAGTRGRAAGFASIGSGFAIVASGWLIPAVNRARGADGWRTNWLILAVAVAAIAVVAALLLRDPPAAPALAAGPARPALPAGRPRAVYVLGLAYAAFGYTYAIYVTFIVTALVRERGFPEATAGRFWSAVGLLSLLSGPVFGALSDRRGRRFGLTLVFALQMVAYLLAAGSGLPRPFLYLSIGLFGVAAWSVPTIMIAAVADHVGPERALPAFGFITFFFGVGQVAGPAVAGLLAERTGSFSIAFLMAAALAAAAILVVGMLRAPGARVAEPQPGA
ncbi:MAG: MFS transporter [Deltaproteobacteria bacterium]|nr:MFS transporter [Deltaproteobacteria bacterium]